MLTADSQATRLWKASDTYFVPKETGGDWKSTSDLFKICCSIARTAVA
jgi:hypothetical protein